MATLQLTRSLLIARRLQPSTQLCSLILSPSISSTCSFPLKNLLLRSGFASKANATSDSKNQVKEEKGEEEVGPYKQYDVKYESSIKNGFVTYDGRFIIREAEPLHEILFTNPERSEDAPPEETWDYRTALVIERYPLMHPPIPEWALDQAAIEDIDHKNTPEAYFYRTIAQREEDKLEREKEESRKEQRRAKDVTDERKQIPVLPRGTKHETTGNFRTTNRCLDKRLYLIIKKSNGKWSFPSEGFESGDLTLLDSMYRCMDTYYSNMKVQMLGYAPISYVAHRYPVEIVAERDGAVGCKIFFMRAKWNRGHPTELPEPFVDWAWLRKDELPKYLSPDYAEPIVSVLVEH